MFLQTTGRHARRRARWWHRWFRSFASADEGMSTAEYAIGTVAAAGFAGVLYMVLTGDSVVSVLRSVIEHAMTVQF
ncbi:DUF4244 domain-containing protein [Amycolatopsis acidicola]|uniref:DUF4244 domain-containing protein n=1 Tax=Amycolatopsis acidicola TaxID=2596893 RepID=A0A5N0UK76_9PSEU|nr:DUF4244 domain-containing protein [Amycolatopsis acidicola]KAA9149486.1 DUF4244 domain-containing protein [Amycolatopsis acidicola]